MPHFFYRGKKPDVIGIFGGGCHGTPLQVNDRLRSAIAMTGRAETKKQHSMNAWLPHASYASGNFSDTSSTKLWVVVRINKHRFRSLYSYWKSNSCEISLICSMRGFCPR